MVVHYNHYPNCNQLVQQPAAFDTDIRNELFATVANMAVFVVGSGIDAIARVDIDSRIAGLVVALLEAVVDIVLFETVKRIAANDSLLPDIAYALAAYLALNDFDDAIVALIVVDIETVAIHTIHFDHQWMASDSVSLLCVYCDRSMTAETSFGQELVVAVIVVATPVFASAGTELTSRNYSDGSFDTQKVNQFDMERANYSDADKEQENYYAGDFVGMEPVNYSDDSVDNETASYSAGWTLNNSRNYYTSATDFAQSMSNDY